MSDELTEDQKSEMIEAFVEGLGENLPVTMTKISWDTIHEAHVRVLHAVANAGHIMMFLEGTQIHSALDLALHEGGMSGELPKEAWQELATLPMGGDLLLSLYNSVLSCERGNKQSSEKITAHIAATEGPAAVVAYTDFCNRVVTARTALYSALQEHGGAGTDKILELMG